MSRAAEACRSLMPAGLRKPAIVARAHGIPETNVRVMGKQLIGSPSSASESDASRPVARRETCMSNPEPRMDSARFAERHHEDDPIVEDFSRIPTSWAAIKFAELAAGLGETAPADPRSSEVEFTMRPVKPGEVLHRTGDKFDAIYIVRAGFFKVVRSDDAGNEQVLGFPMAGDAIGLDAIDLDLNLTDAIALDVSCVVVLPIARLASLAGEHPDVARFLHCLCSREMKRNQSMIRLLGTLSADARVAAFLLQLSDSFGRLGYSRTSFQLRMTRQELASHLGLKHETVSRTFSAFAAAGLLDVDRRSITLRNIPALRGVVESTRRFIYGEWPCRDAHGRLVQRPREGSATSRPLVLA